MIYIDGYPVDIAESEEHRLTADITDFDVESGSDFSDHIRNHPREVTITGLVSNSPLADVLAVRKGIVDSETGQVVGTFVDEAFATFEGIWNGRTPVTIETTLRTYDSMGLAEATFPVDPDTGEALRFTAVFKHVKVVKTSRTATRVRVPRGQGKTRSKGATGWRSQLDADTLHAKNRPAVVTVDGTWDAAKQSYVDKDGKPIDLKTLEANQKPKVNVADYDANGALINKQTGTPVTREPYYTVDYTRDKDGALTADPRYVFPGQGDTRSWWNPRPDGPDTTPLKPQ